MWDYGGDMEIRLAQKILEFPLLFCLNLLVVMNFKYALKSTTYLLVFFKKILLF